MVALALIGKNISKSKSPMVYRKLIGDHITYDLIDCKTTKDIPSNRELFQTYKGVSITSPYKVFFCEGECVPDIPTQVINAVNSLRKLCGGYDATNTDRPAAQEIFHNLLAKYGPMEVLILGDGAMSSVSHYICRKAEIPHRIISRKSVDNFDKLDLANYFEDKNKTPLIINSCAKEFTFKGTLPNEAVFWDYNYDMEEHAGRIASLCREYIDGEELLWKQAQLSINFWELDREHPY